MNIFQNDQIRSVSMKTKRMVSEQRNYLVKTVEDAKAIALGWIEDISLENVVKFGLPEIDDRYHIWRVPLCSKDHGNRLGEVVLDAMSAEIVIQKSTKPSILEARILQKDESKVTRKQKKIYSLSQLRNTIGLGDCEELLKEMPAESVDLVFTSPPYFNARPEYSEYEEYDGYLKKMRNVIRLCHKVLADGRFFVMNTSPVLLRRTTRNESSRRIAVPFDLHRIFIEEGFDFIDDIIWMKPEGAGWATGRGRRFAADRNPLQYKAVPVTEYVMVYRKRTDTLIDWHIRNHPKKEVIEASKIEDGYEKTNVWKICPNTNSPHPAAFPFELADKVIRYYSFQEDVVLDPFAGSGTVGAAAAAANRRFVLFEVNDEYVQYLCQKVDHWLAKEANEVLFLHCKQFRDKKQMLWE